MVDPKKPQGSKNEPIDKDAPARHTFDGIQEDDNDMPRWWVNLFIVTVIFGAGYMLWYHTPLFSPKSLQDEINVALAENTSLQQSSNSSSGEFDFVSAMKDPDMMAKGKETYGSICAACHAIDGGGIVGPNLTDEYWIHGDSFAAIQKLVTEGIADKGMPAWGAVIGPQGVDYVSAYVLTLKGTTPANPKAPQGEKVTGTP
jgi:cytochrome c oxidase cbb3-type subunit 3